jgi:hypothetical protein
MTESDLLTDDLVWLFLVFDICTGLQHREYA